jgi:urease subunit gamma
VTEDAHGRADAGAGLARVHVQSAVLEGARDRRSVADLMRDGGLVLKRGQVTDGVPRCSARSRSEATFPDGTKLVTVHDPIR